MRNISFIAAGLLFGLAACASSGTTSGGTTPAGDGTSGRTVQPGTIDRTTVTVDSNRPVEVYHHHYSVQTGYAGRHQPSYGGPPRDYHTHSGNAAAPQWQPASNYRPTTQAPRQHYKQQPAPVTPTHGQQHYSDWSQPTPTHGQQHYSDWSQPTPTHGQQHYSDWSQSAPAAPTHGYRHYSGRSNTGAHTGAHTGTRMAFGGDYHNRQPYPRPDSAGIGRAEIAEAQHNLAQLGFDPGQVDGVYGPRTRRAVMAYTYHQGMPTDGRVTHSLLTYLRSDIAERIRPTSVSEQHGPYYR